MSEVLSPVFIVTIIGLISGTILSITSYFFHVPADEKADLILSILPGANCAACGFAGCQDYARAVSQGKAKTNLCAPGGSDTALKIAEITGKEKEVLIPRVAYLKCNGARNEERTRYFYNGIESCHAVSMFYGGKDRCTYGCLGYGDCISSCPFGAISIRNGIAFINTEKCTGCGLCVKKCPKGLIQLTVRGNKARLLCNNRDKGGITRKLCAEGCIGCSICARNCDSGAINIINNMAVIDEEKCNSCGKCIEVCPQKVLAF